MYSTDSIQCMQLVSLMTQLDEMGGGPTRLGCTTTACIASYDTVDDGKNIARNKQNDTRSSLVQVLGSSIRLSPGPLQTTSSTDHSPYEFDVCTSRADGDHKLQSIIGKVG
jgi:hypothetical protein